MLEDATVPSWLFDLSGASTPEEAMSALEEGRREAEQPGAPSGLELDLVSLRLGFSFLRYRSGEIDLAALLTMAGELADAANYCDPSCEAFFSLLNEIDGGGPTQPRSEPLTDRVEALFRPHITAVEHWLTILAVQGERRDNGRDSTPDLEQSLTAEIYRPALLLGLEQPSSVADWANGVIDATETVDLHIVDLALVGSNVGEAVGLLNRIAEPGRPAITASAFRRLARLLLARLDQDALSSAKAAALLYDLSRSGDQLPPQWAHFASWVDTAFALAAQGIADGPAAEQALREFLMEEAGTGEDP